MVQKTVVQLLDDINGEDAAETLTLALDGVTYELDLTEEHAAELRADVSKWTEYGRRKVGSGPVPRRRAQTDREQSNAMREWGRKNGFQVSDRGAIPKALREAYNASAK